MWHKAGWKGHRTRLELTLSGLLVKITNHYTTRGLQFWEKFGSFFFLNLHFFKIFGCNSLSGLIELQEELIEFEQFMIKKNNEVQDDWK